MSQRPDFRREKSAFLLVGKLVSINWVVSCNLLPQKNLLSFSMVTRWSHSSSHSYLRLFKVWQVSISSRGQFMQHLETCLLIAEADSVLCRLISLYVLSVFLHWIYKWNTSAIKNLLLFMAGVFVGFLVEKHSACKKGNRKPSFSKISFSSYFTLWDAWAGSKVF